MKYLPAIAGALLGFIFVASGVVVLFRLVPMPPPPEGTPAGLFMGALYPTGYLGFIKVIEILGGIFVAIPRTRNIGLLLLGPVIVNILAFHTFIMKGAGLASVSIGLIVALPLYLLWTERKAFAALVKRPA